MAFLKAVLGLRSFRHRCIFFNDKWWTVLTKKLSRIFFQQTEFYFSTISFFLSFSYWLSDRAKQNSICRGQQPRFGLQRPPPSYCCKSSLFFWVLKDPLLVFLCWPLRLSFGSGLWSENSLVENQIKMKTSTYTSRPKFSQLKKFCLLQNVKYWFQLFMWKTTWIFQFPVTLNPRKKGEDRKIGRSKATFSEW